jgi:hypothetical protein
VQVIGGVIVLAWFLRTEMGLDRSDGIDYRERWTRDEADALALVDPGSAHFFGQDRVWVDAVVEERLTTDAPILVKTREKGCWVARHTPPWVLLLNHCIRCS